MPVSCPLCVGASPATAFLPPRRNHFLKVGNSRECVPARVSSRSLQSGKKLCTLVAVGASLPQPVAITHSSKNRKSVFTCNAALNARCSQGQTQTVTRKAPTITQAPVHGEEKSLSLDDGGNGFPPRDDGGGGGGGGGGGMPSSGGFFLFGFLLFMSFLKDLEGENDG
ncbi:PREDICTED: uncharacterized protein LOC104798603 isoform X2 [Tarenaya hassleriana]|nr:PREDICTED: uncharacterized protein LOC104798603 isoform X2 [Tarenaya hassleriana]